MSTSLRRRALGGLIAACGLCAGALGSPSGAQAAGLSYSLATVGAYGGEPSFISDSKGVLYETTPSGGTVIYRSTDHGTTWQQRATADAKSGDDCLGADQANAVYLCNLAGTPSTAPLQADVWKSVDQGGSWTHGAGAVPMTGTSSSVFGVDRDWVAASINPPATTTAKAEVVLMYHDFYGPSHIWVNISTDGGATFGAPVEVLSSPAVTPGAVAGTVEAEGYTFCNTVPSGVGIVPPGRPHAGRIIVGWIAADAPQDLTGCNISMAQSFHTLWVSYSDDNGTTWTPQLAYDAGIGHDASTPFVGFTLDDQGNPYFGFAAPGPNGNPVVCAAESTAGSVQGDASCAYDMYVVWSADGGATWDGGGGLIPGSAATAYQVNAPADVGTHFFPAISAQAPGHVDVAYLETPQIIATDALGKEVPGACSGMLPNYTTPCPWNLYAAQSSNLTAAPAAATWTSARLTPVPMHVGDICNLGIACVPNLSNRNLLDFFQMAIDPTTGCAHIGYADDNTVNKLRAANQTSGCFSVAAATGAGTTAGTTAATGGSPNTGAAPAPPAAGMAGGIALALGIGCAARRRRRIP